MNCTLDVTEGLLISYLLEITQEGELIKEIIRDVDSQISDPQKRPILDKLRTGSSGILRKDDLDGDGFDEVYFTQYKDLENKEKLIGSWLLADDHFLRVNFGCDKMIISSELSKSLITVDGAILFAPQKILSISNSEYTTEGERIEYEIVGNEYREIVYSLNSSDQPISNVLTRAPDFQY